MFIPEIGRDLNGRQLDIWRGHDDAGNALDMPPSQQEGYRAAWRAAAQKIEPCRHFTDAPIDRAGCGSCQGNWKYPCDLFGACSPKGRWPLAQTCAGCKFHQPDDGAPDRPVRRVVLTSRLCPGDAVVFGVAVDMLHRAHPGRFLTAIDSAAPELWAFHPNVAAAPESADGRRAAGWETVEVNYPLIDRSDELPIHFMQGYCHGLERALGVRVPLQTNRPTLHLSDEEKGWRSQVADILGSPAPYWIVNAGRKRDYTAKWWGAAAYQELVDRLRGRVLFAQIGELSDTHDHPKLEGVIDLRGKTDTRQLMRLVHNSQGAVGPSTFLQHLCAALDRRYVLLAGGREPVAWQHYPRQTTLSVVGRLPCCADRSCWRSRTVRLGDGDKKDDSVCALPVLDRAGEFVPKCLATITPKEVARIVAGN